MPVFSILLSSGVLAGIIFLFWRNLGQDSTLKVFFWPALLLKLLCGILVGLMYAENFDTHIYQKMASRLTDFGFQNPAVYLRLVFLNDYSYTAIVSGIQYKTYSNSFFFAKLLSLLNFLTGRQYYLNSLFLSVFSFAGCWYFVVRLAYYFPNSQKAAVIAFLFFPSVVFWNSGVLKESILMGSLCFFWGSSLNLLYNSGKRNWFSGLLLLLSAYWLWKIKFFVAALVFCLTGTWLGFVWLEKKFVFFRQGFARWLILPLLVGFLAIIMKQWHEEFELDIFFRRLVWNYKELQSLSPGRPTIHFSGFEPNLYSVLSNIPEALFSCLFRPFPWEGNNYFYFIAGLENLVIFILFACAILGLFRGSNLKMNGFYLVLLIFCLVVAVTFAMATPNLGSLNRYRTTFLPFLIFLFLQTPFWQTFLNRFSFPFLKQR